MILELIYNLVGDYIMDISDNLKYFFEGKKLENVTAVEVAKKLNISKSTLSNYINGDAYIPLEHLNKICNMFDISVDYILGFTKKNNYKNRNLITVLDPKEIGTRLHEIRKELKVTLLELANIIGINKSTISRYENGKNLILTITLYSICKNYKISADYLLGRIDKPKYLK